MDADNAASAASADAPYVDLNTLAVRDRIAISTRGSRGGYTWRFGFLTKKRQNGMWSVRMVRSVYDEQAMTHVVDWSRQCQIEVMSHGVICEGLAHVFDADKYVYTNTDGWSTPPPPPPAH
jgi:hypothetical protein